ncbi:YitT family protein [Clostridium hydrogeniformans]|uniref:YitT family protein n=1 Tax=Clostridium hydrogeniformans TaxID=349933 RepID=UPI0005567921|nr:YitT family protein [Clostridium hydrogeniformans]
MKNQIKAYIKITFGVFLVAIATYFFIMANNVAGGGINGLGLVINHYIPGIPVGALMTIMNIILFIVAFILIGPHFGARTVYASFLLSGIIWGLEKLYPISKPLTNDILLELMFAIMLLALGLATIFNENASTGGTDIIAKILNKYLNINLGKGVLLSDLVVTVLAAITFGFTGGLYALFVVILNGVVIDRFIEGFNICKEVRIISNNLEDIRKFILNELGRGATIYYAKGAFSDGEVKVLWTIVDSKEFIRIKNYVKEIDKYAFLSVTDVCETLGDGFKAFE